MKHPKFDPIELTVFKSAFFSIAEEMGAALRRTAFSPNIKERRDYSSAVFDGKGRIIAMGDDMPVHLGSMPLSVTAVLQALQLQPGDAAILNDPYAGGTHLPDITMVMPVFVRGSTVPAFFVANRAHHADMGGMYPGSMGPCNEIYQEGFRIPPLKLAKGGDLNRDLVSLLLSNVRTPWEREGDLTAQLGACRTGVERVAELISKYGLNRADRNVEQLLNHSERLMRAELKRFPAGEFPAEDYLDDDGMGSGPVAIRVSIRTQPDKGKLTADFSASDPQVAGNVNAVFAVTYSAVFYVLRCLLPPEAAPTAGIMRPIRVLTREGSIVHARRPAAVAAGNVETSQRIVDTLLRALAKAIPLRIPAASAGTMNNVTIGGIDPRTNQPFAYYETIAGGAGATPRAAGIAGVHTHMTNSMNTPVEALEYAYPLRVRRYSYRRGSGGDGQYHGGDGLIREIEFLADSQVALLADRQKAGPYGLSGGNSGASGKAVFEQGNESTVLEGKCSFRVRAGATLRIETPGGGGWGRPPKKR